MINKKNLLGKVPAELGIKDAVHVAIVAVRAARLIPIGCKCSINENGEAVPDNKGVGVADPFRKAPIYNGDSFWLMLNQDEVSNVKHTWDHPKFTFEPPTTPVVLNNYLQGYANDFRITYKELIDACWNKVNEGDTKYKGPLTEDELDELDIDYYDLWSEWAQETGYEFENFGTECCAEYEYPSEIFS